jgi:hypothetical protein
MSTVNGSFSAKERADAISVRITNLADQYGLIPIPSKLLKQKRRWI